MLNPEDRERIQNAVRTNRYIWFAFIDSFVLYTVLLFVITRFGSGEPLQDDGVFGFLLTLISRADIGVLKALFISVSFILVVIRFLILGRLWLREDSYRNCQTLDRIIGRYNQYFFITLALSEVPALLGLVVVFLTGWMQDWWLFFIIAMVICATSVPRASKVESIVQAHAARVL